MFPVGVPRIFKTAERESVVKSHISKVLGEINAFYNSFRNSITCFGNFREIAVLEIWKNDLLIGDVGLQSRDCNITKNELLTKLLKGGLKLSEHFHEDICMEFLQPSAMWVFKIP